MNYIFDFDGTIADSLRTVISIFDRYVHDSDGPLTEKEIASLRDMSSKEALSKVGIRWWQMPRLAIRFKPIYKTYIPDLKSFEGLKEALEVIGKRGDKMFIVTSNGEAAVKEFLKTNNLDKYFTKVYCNAGIFKKSKYIHKVIKEYNLDRKNTVYVGDETRDVAAARSSHITSVSVAWGFNSVSALKKVEPDFLINEPKELLSIKLS